MKTYAYISFEFVGLLRHLCYTLTYTVICERAYFSELTANTLGDAVLEIYY